MEPTATPSPRSAPSAFATRRVLGALFALSLVLSLWLGLHAWLGLRLAEASGVAFGPLFGAAVFLGTSYLLGRVAALRLPRLGVVLTWIGAVWMGFFCITVSVFAVHDLVLRLPLALAEALGLVDAARSAQILGASQLGAAGLALGASAWALVRGLGGPRLREERLALEGLPEAALGLRIAHGSDVHVGETIGPAYLARIARRVREARAELVVLTGDLSDERNGGDGKGLRLLAGLAPSEALPVVCCTGNHELYAGGEHMVEAQRRAGLCVLRQERRVVVRGAAGLRLAEQVEPGEEALLIVAGVDDPSFLGGRSGLVRAYDEALAAPPAAVPVLLLAHQPVAVAEAAAAVARVGLPSALMLSGHTHAGQLPPITFFARFAYKAVRGLHRVGALMLSVSNGTGYWGPPMRLFAPPEVVVYELVPRS